MMVRDGIVSAIVAALAEVEGIGADAVDLEPTGDPDIFPSFAVYDGGHTVLEREAGLTRRAMTVSVEGYVQRGDGAEASAERNALHAQGVAALMDNDTLGGLVEQIEDGDLRLTTAVLSDKARLAFSQDFTIIFVTARTNPAMPG